MAVNLKPEGAEVEKLNPYHSLHTRGTRCPSAIWEKGCLCREQGICPFDCLFASGAVPSPGVGMLCDCAGQQSVHQMEALQSDMVVKRTCWCESVVSMTPNLVQRNLQEFVANCLGGGNKFRFREGNSQRNFSKPRVPHKA